MKPLVTRETSKTPAAATAMTGLLERLEVAPAGRLNASVPELMVVRPV